MAKLQVIFTENLRKHRRKCGFTQARLAEKVGVSTHHIGMIELSRNFPALELVERLAHALNIEVYELFLDPHSSNKEFERLRQVIRSDMEEVLAEFLESMLPAKRKNKTAEGNKRKDTMAKKLGKALQRK